MPLIHRSSNKAFKKNVETEMNAHPGDRAQNLAIAYSIQRQAKKKKMAEGGKLDSEYKKHMYADGGEVEEDDHKEQQHDEKDNLSLESILDLDKDHKYAEGGKVHEDMDDEDEMPLVDRIMHKKHMKKMAEGGLAGIEDNATEYGPDRSFNPELYDYHQIEDAHEMDDENQEGFEDEDETHKDIVSRIMRKKHKIQR